MTTTYRLIVKEGMLFFPSGCWTDPELPSLLYWRYDAGDVDVCPWPMQTEAERIRLAHALFDERETNEDWTVRDTTIIELPDGTVFDFDQLVS